MTNSSEHDNWGLIMPFVVVTSAGGPYPDDAFVAGVRYGRWAELLKLQPSQHSNFEPIALVPQLDLLAMHHHYIMIVEPWDDGDGYWVCVTMTLGELHEDLVENND